jgi:hypothetical protein
VCSGYTCKLLEVVSTNVSALLERLDLSLQRREGARGVHDAAEGCFQGSDLVGIAHAKNLTHLHDRHAAYDPVTIVRSPPCKTVTIPPETVVRLRSRSLVRGLHSRTNAINMFGPPDTRAVSISTAGYEDGLGRRSVRFDREVGGMLECLHLRPELWAFEANLRDAAAAIASLDDERFVRVRAIERGPHGLVVVSEVVPGQRFLDIIDTRERDDAGAFGIDASLGFLMQVLPALSTLHTLSIAHGALAPGRILVTGAGQIVLLDGIYATALERLNLSRASMWTHLGLLTPPFAGAPRFDRQADLAQAALCGLVLAVGRSVIGAGDASVLRPLLSELREVAEIRGGAMFADRVQEFFHSLLPAAGRRATLSADLSAAQAEQLAEMIGEEGCHAAFSQLARIDSAIARITAVPLDAPEEFEAYVESDDITETEATHAPETSSARSQPAYPPAVALIATPPIAVVAPSLPPPAPAAVFTPAPVVEAPAVLPVAPAALPVTPAPPYVTPPTVQAVLVPPPVVPGPPAPHVTSVSPSPAVPPPPAQVVQSTPFSPAPVVFTPPPQTAPLAPPPIPVLAPPPIPVLVSPPVAAAPPVPTTGISPAVPAPLKVRQEPPAGFTPARTEPEPAHRALPFVDRAVPERMPQFPWKLAAAAVIVLAVGIVAGRTYVQGSPDVAPVIDPPKPVAAAGVAPTTETTGGLAIDTQPSGAKVALDGVDVGVAPLKLDSVSPGKHVVVVTTDAATIRRTIRVEPGRVVSLDVPVFSGWVSVFSPIPLDIAAEGKTLGNTDTGKILLSPGKHALTLSNSEFGFSDTRTVEIQPGEERPLNIEPKGIVNVNAHPWAEVWIDGKKAGDTPIANLAVLMGTRIFTFKHPQYGERRVTVTVTSTAGAVSVDFTKP